MYIDGAKKIMGNLKKKNYRYAWFLFLKTVFVLCVFYKIKNKKNETFSLCFLIFLIFCNKKQLSKTINKPILYMHIFLHKIHMVIWF